MSAGLLFALLGPHSGEKPAELDGAGGKVAAGPPSSNAGAVTPDPGGPAPATAPSSAAANAEANTSGWIARGDFGAELRRQAANGAYPDKIAARCDDGVLKVYAHWAPRPPGIVWRFFGTNDDNFDAKSAELKAQGFALEYDNVFKDCQGRTRHQGLWRKEG